MKKLRNRVYRQQRHLAYLIRRRGSQPRRYGAPAISLPQTECNHAQVIRHRRLGPIIDRMLPRRHLWPILNRLIHGASR